MSRRHRFSTKAKAHQLSTGDNRVASYIRRSTEEQANSLEAQRMLHTSFAAKRDLIIDEFFCGDGVSATATDFLHRRETKEMIRHMQARGLRTILLLRVDRVFRSNRDFQLSMVELEKLGIFLRFIDPDIDYGTPIGRMMITQMVSMAEYEGQIRNQRQDEAMESIRARRLAITPNAIAYGWLPNGPSTTLGRNGKPQIALKPNLPQQVILAWLKSAYEADPSYGVWTRLARQLNAWAVPTRDGHQWQAASVKSVLSYENLLTESELETITLPSLEQAIAALSSTTHRSAA